MAKLTFVVGKGGVGKTTVSCALALHLAAGKGHEPVLLLSTDPAHSLADMLQIKLGSTARKVAVAKGQLCALQIDSSREFKKFLAENREAILDIVENGTFFNREEIAPLLDATLPGMAEVAALLALQNLLEQDRYAHIVVDTAPFGHTLRLFELPAHFHRFLHFLDVASSRDALLAQRFGGRISKSGDSFLERWQSMVNRLSGAFDSRIAEVLLVTSPESFSLNEAARSMGELENSLPQMNNLSIVLNRVTEEPIACLDCRKRAQAARRAKAWLKQRFPGRKVFTGPDPGNPLLGVRLLKAFGDVVFTGRTGTKLSLRAPRSGDIRFKKVEWPLMEVPLSFTAGKGGVGKTTTTAAIAFRSRTATQKRVTVCSTDPAPSLDDVFQQEIGNVPVQVFGDRDFSAAEFDSVGEFQKWTQDIRRRLDSELSMETRGLHVDLTLEREVFAALLDVVPPGVDEIFATFRIMDLLEKEKGRVLIDMAPTGHALELLRMPERMLLWSRLLLKSLSTHRRLAFAQDVAVELASLSQRLRKLIDMMKDPARSRTWLVMLPEPVPDKQTVRLLASLKEIGVSVDSIFVNRVQVKATTRCQHCKCSRAWQMATLKGCKKAYASNKTYIVPESPNEIAGERALKRFTESLWQIAQ